MKRYGLISVILILICALAMFASCDIRVNIACSHKDNDNDGNCDLCGEFMYCITHTDDDKNGRCDKCGEYVPCTEHIDEDKNGRCDICGERVECKEHVDADKNGICDVCGEDVPCVEHIDEDKNGRCDVCGEKLSCATHVDANGDRVCDVCKEKIPCTSHEDKDNNGKCDYCGATVPCTGDGGKNPHVDADKNGKCDKCGEKLKCKEHVDQDKNGKCDVCGERVSCSEHTDANRDLICDVCGERLPCIEHVDADNDMICDVCGTYYDCVEHTDKNEDYICDRCDARLEFTNEAQLPLILYGEARFRFVLSANCPSKVKSAIALYVRSMERVGINIAQVTDETDDDYGCEILIGDVSNRESKYLIDSHELGNKGYIIKRIDNKIIVNGGSEDALQNVVDKFLKSVMCYKSSTVNVNEMQTIVYKKDDINIQTGYRITSVKLDGEDMKGYTIAVDQDNADYLAAAKELQSMFYVRAGYWFPIVDIAEAGRSFIIEHVDKYAENGVSVGPAGDKGFRVLPRDGAVYIMCAYDNMFLKAFSNFSSGISIKEGDILFTTGKNYYTEEISKLYYKDFNDIKGDGRTDDFLAIKAVHEIANAGGQTVIAENGKTYYIRDTGGDPIKILTNVNFGTAKFLIDDSNITVDKVDEKERRSDIFVIPYVSLTTITTSNDRDGILAAINERGGLKTTDTTLDLGLGYRAMVIPTNNDHRMYVRHGSNQNTGNPQHELLIVNPDGTIDDSAPLLFDFDHLTSLTIVNLEAEPLTIKGGIFITDPTTSDQHGSYIGFARGFRIQRANVTFDGIEHQVLNTESPTGASYDGFLYFSYSDNTLVKNSKLSGRKYFGQGTYDIGGNQANKMVFENCTQYNMYRDANENTVYTNTEFWGIMGTNYCKNIEYYNCKLSRLDAHAGVVNVVIKDCEISIINLIGGGQALIEGTKIYNNTFVGLRSDYGSTWRGDITFRNCEMVAQSQNPRFVLVSGSYIPGHNFGYKTSLPQNIIVDNVTHNKGKSYTNFYVLHYQNIQESSLISITNGIENVNILLPGQSITITERQQYKLNDKICYGSAVPDDVLYPEINRP